MLLQEDADDPESIGILAAGSVAGHNLMFRLDTGAARTHVAAVGHLAEQVPTRSARSAGVFGQVAAQQIITAWDLAVGELELPELDVARVPADEQSLLGMDVLGGYCCRFRFDAGLLELSDSSAAGADLELTLDERCHPYVQLAWAGVTASACWDSGASITVVHEAFRNGHPGLFVAAGSSTGTDPTGAISSTPIFTMAGPVIGGVPFPATRVAVVDLGPMNRELQCPMDAILGAPTIRQANWIFDFPARRWAAPQLLAIN
jgi:gag-polyprotein putative aspartyl protease